MASSNLVSAITIESEGFRLPEPPVKAIQIPRPGTSDDQIDIELNQISNGIVGSSSGDPEVFPTSSEDADGADTGPNSEQIQTIWNPYKNRFRVLASCMTAFGNGLNDSAPGALIASLER
jgi:hypothetical protein